MKKLFFFLTFFFLIDNCFAEEFVNPVFNKTLYAYSRGSWNTLLTPNSITEYPSDSSVSDIYTQKHSCKLLENEFDHIKYDCLLCYQAFFEKEKNCSEKIIFFRIADNGLIEKQSFKPHSLEYYNLQYYTTNP
ncbi:MAG: hypothetical protein IJ870_02605 [Alphaproteobacteria bacterium]|nr:hypothetical protein [Alphaproteobacteria bacterium]